MAKLLLIDDDKLMVAMYQDNFQKEGYVVEVANDGEAGLQKVSEFKPDLILLDVVMPKVDGIEVLKKLKENEATKTIPVVMLTNQGETKVEASIALNLGAVAYLVKAANLPKEVMTKVKEILGGYVDEVKDVY